MGAFGPAPPLPLGGPFVGGPPPPPPMPLPQQQAPQADDGESVIYEIDPEVLSQRVKIRIDASSRMVTKDTLAQTIQFMTPLIANGPFVQQLLTSGYAIDWPTFFEMAQAATGTSRQYHLIRPINAKEEARLAEPPPQVKAQMAKTQSDVQIRTQLGQMKMQSEQAQIQSNERMKQLEIEEASARHLLDLIQQQREESDPTAQAKLQAEMQKTAMGLQAKQAEHKMKLTAQHQQHQMDMAQAVQKAELDSRLQQHQANMDTALAQRQASMDHEVAHTKARTQVHSILATGLAKAKAAKMMPARPAGGAKSK